MKKERRREWAVWLTWDEIVAMRDTLRHTNFRDAEQESALKIFEKRIKGMEKV